MHPKDAHSSCISEEEKYQKSLYKGKKEKPAASNAPAPAKTSVAAPAPAPTKSEKEQPKKQATDSEPPKKKAKVDESSKKKSSKSSARAAKACEPAALKDTIAKLGGSKGVTLAELAEHLEKSNDIKRSRVDAALFKLRLTVSDGRLTHDHVSSRNSEKAKLRVPSGDERFFLLTSPSRGLDKAAGLDAEFNLLQPTVQQEYRIVASGRHDAFAIEVYELSVLVSILCGNLAQLATSAPLDELYNIATTTHIEQERLANDVKMLVGDVSIDDHATLFRHLLRLEPLCSGRTGHLQHYLAHNGDVCSPVYTSLVHGSHLDHTGVFWVDTLCLHLVPRLREEAWTTLRRSYMVIPLRTTIASAINEGPDASLRLLNAPLDPDVTSDRPGVQWLERELYLQPPWATPEALLALLVSHFALIGRKARPSGGVRQGPTSLERAKAVGAVKENDRKTNAGTNKAYGTDHQHIAKLDRENEVLPPPRVPPTVGKLISQARQAKNMTQKDLSTRINEKPNVVSEYEQGRAIPNPQILGKMERVLGVKLRGKNIGAPLGGPKK
ncbi:multiprotein-bridging factor 1 [Malassezia cuniculi]|uniref:Multiprotein-bridging factor 1 n=1 Tax=Malassezia cuniculi TaxID=948313 RepID=A0AAF0J555_9BASI|nr:multiprotein-bridging factor 1 [Malassezia cuniculi]